MPSSNYLPVWALVRIFCWSGRHSCRAGSSVVKLSFSTKLHYSCDGVSKLLGGTKHPTNGYLDIPGPQMTPARLMRSLLPSRLLQRSSSNAILKITSAATIPTSSSSAQCDPRACLQNCRCFAQIKDLDALNREIYFTSSPPRSTPPDPNRPPDARTIQLGKTVRTLHERLPTLLQSPLPSDILSPNISLHLFPSTHPHLPTVSGRIAYVAALWTAPVAWGRVPLVGNVKLTILSERMVRNEGATGSMGRRDEKLLVKWKTCGKTKHRDSTGGVYRGAGASRTDPANKIRDFITGTTHKNPNGDEETEFTGLFIFEFDNEGRIVKHVIEHTEEGGRWDHMTRVVSVTDWLLGQFNGKSKKEQIPELAWCEERPSRTLGRISIVDRSQRRT